MVAAGERQSLAPEERGDLLEALVLRIRDAAERQDPIFTSFSRNPYLHQRPTGEGRTGTTSNQLGEAGTVYLALVEAIGVLQKKLADGDDDVPTDTEDALRWLFGAARRIAEKQFSRQEGRTVGSAAPMSTHASFEGTAAQESAAQDGTSEGNGSLRQIHADARMERLLAELVDTGAGRGQAGEVADEQQKKKGSATFFRSLHHEPLERPEVGPIRTIIKWVTSGGAYTPRSDRGTPRRAPYGSAIFSFTPVQAVVLVHMGRVLGGALDRDPQYQAVADLLDREFGIDVTGDSLPRANDAGKRDTAKERAAELERALRIAVEGAARVTAAVVNADYAKTLRSWHEARATVVEVLYLLGGLSRTGAFASVDTLSSWSETLDEEFRGEYTDATRGGKVLRVLKTASRVARPTEWGGAEVTPERWRGLLATEEAIVVKCRAQLSALLGADEAENEPVVALHWCEDVVACRMQRQDPECVDKFCEGHPLASNGLKGVRR